MAAEKPLCLCLMGPTASGKTDLAIALAEQANCELISVDSALVYRGLDIGSAKPDYPHHLVDIRDPAEPYSAADFMRDASELVADITERGRTPLLVGGTMLYFRALIEGLASMPAADATIRATIEDQALLHGWPYLHAQLAAVDPESAQRIHPNHSQRLGRALEVYRASGVPLSEWHRRTDETGERPLAGYRLAQLAICPANRQVLHERIAQRFQSMLEAGLVEEVQRLRERTNLHLNLPALRAVGYRQIWQHLEGEYSLEDAEKKAVAATRQLAKRQLTWLRKWPDLAWILTDQQGKVAQGSEIEDLQGGLNVLNTQIAENRDSSPVHLALSFLATD